MRLTLHRLSLFIIMLLILFGILSTIVLGQGPDITILPTPTVMPSPSDMNLSPLPEAAANHLPDLIVTKIETYPAAPQVGQATTISVTIKNQGTVSLQSGNNFITGLYIDPPAEPVVNDPSIIISPTLGLPWGVQWFSVPPGGSQVLTTTWIFTDVTTFEVWAMADSGNNVVEEDEDNNARPANISVTTRFFKQDSHEDFLTNMASSLDNSDAAGFLRLGSFFEPPFYQQPFTNNACQITTDLTVSDYNMTTMDSRVNQVTTGKQIDPYLLTSENGVVVAVWADGRNGEVADRDIYLRYSTDSGETWSLEQRVNDDTIGANQLGPVAALGDQGDLLVAWTDNRHGDYDIFAQSYLLNGSTLTASGDNILVGGDASYNAGEQINPDIAVDEVSNFHVVWQDKRNNNYDIFATSLISSSGSLHWTLVRRVHDDFGITQQVNPSVQALDWLEVQGINYTIEPTDPYTVTVNSVISTPTTILVVTWEDDRNGDNDIAMTISTDGGETYTIDQFLTFSAADGDQQNPDVTLTRNLVAIPFRVPHPENNQESIEAEVEVPVSDIHTVWEGYTTQDNADRDIFYHKSQLGTEQIGTNNEFRYKLTVGSNETINQEDSRTWQTIPVDQRDPAVAAVRCGGSTGEDAWNIFIAWADGRNYDSANYDIYFDLISSCGADLKGNRMLNDGVRLHQYDADDPNYSDYSPGNPPPARQLNPSIATNIELDGLVVFGGYVYVAWEDDRAGNPQQEKDVYFARSNLTLFNQEASLFGFGAGSQISSILDSGDLETTWYTIAWSAATPASTYITVQTRLGNTIAEVLAGDWYPQRFPYQPQVGDCLAANSGAPLQGYDAPGQHIENAAGSFWPKARYIQYRVNFYTRDSTLTPELDRMTIYYNPTNSPNTFQSNKLYLPLIRR